MQSRESNSIVCGTEDMAAAKIAVFKECGIEVAATPSDMADALLRREGQGCDSLVTTR